MKLLVVVTSPSIYHGCSNRKMFWEEKFTGKENLFPAVEMKNYGRRNVRKHKEIRGSDKYVTLKKQKDIRGSDKYVTLDISSKFDSLGKMEIISSESKGKLERSEKGLVTVLDFKTKARSQKYKKSRYAIGNVSEKNISKIIKEFEKIEKLPYEKKKPKHEPTDRYFHLARHLVKCIMISDNLKWYDHGGYAETTTPSSNVNVTNKGKSKHSIVKEKLSRSCSTNEDELKRSIINEKLSHSCSTNKDELKQSIVNETLLESCSTNDNK